MASAGSGDSGNDQAFGGAFGKGFDKARVEEVARRLFESLPPAFRTMQQDLETNFRAVLRANLGRLDLVARDEFDAQTKVLERTRARLEELERRFAELESKLPPG
ncbi:MAG: accessory factor UbiK family protein [Steroidobacteraceae bacterium]|jgi:BMFP domain-containing protein YqiC